MERYRGKWRAMLQVESTNCSTRRERAREGQRETLLVVSSVVQRRHNEDALCWVPSPTDIHHEERPDSHRRDGEENDEKEGPARSGSTVEGGDDCARHEDSVSMSRWRRYEVSSRRLRRNEKREEVYGGLNVKLTRSCSAYPRVERESVDTPIVSEEGRNGPGGCSVPVSCIAKIERLTESAAATGEKVAQLCGVARELSVVYSSLSVVKAVEKAKSCEVCLRGEGQPRTRKGPEATTYDTTDESTDCMTSHELPWLAKRPLRHSIKQHGRRSQTAGE